MSQFHITFVCLVQLKIEVAEHSCQCQVEFGVCEADVVNMGDRVRRMKKTEIKERGDSLNSQTRPRAFTETHKIAIQTGFVLRSG